MYILQDKLKILNLARYNHWINHFKIYKFTNNEILHTDIFNFVLFLSKASHNAFILLIELYK